MQLDKVTAVIRPRTPWEAVDLGFTMARQWWRPLLLSWLVVTLPLYVVLYLLFMDKTWIAMLVLWWGKPLWERTQLYILSHALFGDLPSVKQTVSAFPRLARLQILASLTWRRFSPSRSMDVAVIQLEGLSGEKRSQRLNILHRRDSGAASWLTIIGVHIESFLEIAAIMLIFSFIPDEVNVSLWGLLSAEQQPWWFELLLVIAYYAAVAVVGPFYSAAGFALYLNRRIHLEAWDIEVAFRRLAQRHTDTGKPLSGSITALLFVTLLSCCFFMPESAGAVSETPSTPVSPAETNPAAKKPSNDEPLEVNKANARQLIDEVFELPEFNNKKIIRLPKFLIGEEQQDNELREIPQWLENIIRWFAEGFRALIWGLVLFLILLLVFHYRDWVMPLLSGRRQIENNAKPAFLFGLDVRGESLPDDVSQAALALSRQGRYREALALLYRATLAQLLEHYHLPIRAGHTEGECVDLAKTYAPADLSDYFSRLNHVWIRVAYGHQPPDDETLRNLCTGWQMHMNVTAPHHD